MKKLFLFGLLSLFLTSCAPQTRSLAPPTVKSKPHKPVQKQVTKETPKKKSAKLKIAIDAGHGGKDPGTKAVVAPFTAEKVYTLKTALKVKEFLAHWGYDVYLTRKSDVFVPLLERVEKAEKNRCTLFVSIHYNSAKRKTAQGVQVYYYRQGKNSQRIKHSHSLASCIFKRMVKVAKPNSRGVLTGNFAVIRENKIPSVLIEAGFLSNPQEAKKLKNPNYLKFLSWAIAKGIEDFVTTEIPSK